MRTGFVENLDDHIIISVSQTAVHKLFADYIP